MATNSLVISTPTSTIVGHKSIIQGVVDPPATRVQVLVYSADAQWYLQKDAVVDADGSWTAVCKFGYPCSPGHDFGVVATADVAIHPSPVSEIPAEAFQSDHIIVSRLT